MNIGKYFIFPCLAIIQVLQTSQSEFTPEQREKFFRGTANTQNIWSGLQAAIHFRKRRRSTPRKEV